MTKTTNTSRKVPLHLILVVSCVLQISGSVGLTGWLAYRNGQQTVNDLAEQLLSKTSQHIQDKLETYTTIPPLVTQINATSLQLGQLDLNNSPSWQSYLFEQSQLFDGVTYIYFGGAGGEYVELRRFNHGKLEYSIKNRNTNQLVEIYPLDAQGNLSPRSKTDEYDPHTRPWYQNAIKAGKPIWTNIYEFIDAPPTLGISFTRPYYDEKGTLQGVLGTDFTLLEFNQFLSLLKIGKSGKTFIIERTGELVASSANTPPITPDNQRIKAVNIDDALMQATALNLTERFEDFTGIDETQQLNFKLDGKRQLVQVAPFEDEWGLDWLIVVVVPESDFMEQIYANTRTTILLCLGALGMAIGLGVATARWISLPIRRLSKASKAIADGEFNRKVAVANIEELGILVQSFNQMSTQLWRSHQQLENYSQSLEEQVNIRTQELQQEIEERQLLEQKLYTSEAQIRAFFEAMTDIVLLIDAESQTIKSAPTHPERLYPPETDILAQTINQFLGEQAEVFQSQMKQALDTQQIVNFEYSLTLNTEPVWFVASIAPTSENSVVWVARDISDRKQAEEALHLIVEGTAAKTGNEFFRSCVRYLAQVLHVRYALVTEVVDESHRQVRTLAFWTGENWSEQIEYDLAGTPCEQVLAGSSCYYRDDVRDCFPEDQELMALDVVSYLGIPLLDSANNVLGHLAVLDVQSMGNVPGRELILRIFAARAGAELERKQAEIAQQQATAAALAANQAKSEFLANMSHELRTPLTAILGLTEVLQDEVYGSLSGKQHQKLGTIERSGKHLLELINDVLDLAKIESGKMELQLAPSDIQGLCNASLAFVRQQAHQQKIQLTAKIPPQIGKAIVDERRLRQVLINLLSNAVKFTPEGGAVWVEVQGEPENDVLQFSVVDTGIGIAPEQFDKLFEPFVQLDSSLSRRYRGTGLGLALVKQVVELHGGSIELETEVERGSRFTVSLPWKRERQDRQGVREKRCGGNEQQTRGPGDAGTRRVEITPHMLILLAEDNETTVATISDYFKVQGYRVAVAINGLEAVEMSQELNPDLIVMDIQMPEMDGLEATRQIRVNEQSAHIPIIALTSLAMPGDKEKCLEAGADEYLTKPVSLKKLVEAINALLS
ncbi:MAG: response regulator [Symploca sp. SIO2C1]|nr:response regulator [Symploca sp. SIO2C1]